MGSICSPTSPGLAPRLLATTMWLRGGCRSQALVLCIIFFSFPSLTKAGALYFSTGFYATTRSQPQTLSGVEFSVTEGGTTALCSLAVSVDLDTLVAPQVVCSSLYDLVGIQIAIGKTYKEWSFYSNIGGQLYQVEASLVFNPTEQTIASLTLCFSQTCSPRSSSSTGSNFCLTYQHTSSSSSSSSSCISSKLSIGSSSISSP